MLRPSHDVTLASAAAIAGGDLTAGGGVQFVFGGTRDAVAIAKLPHRVDPVVKRGIRRTPFDAGFPVDPENRDAGDLIAIIEFGHDFDVVLQPPRLPCQFSLSSLPSFRLRGSRPSRSLEQKARPKLPKIAEELAKFPPLVAYENGDRLWLSTRYILYYQSWSSLQLPRLWLSCSTMLSGKSCSA